jgi:hypothetical protein
MNRPIEQMPIHMSLEKVDVCAGHNVQMEVDDNISPIVVNPHGIFDQQLRSRPIHFLNIIIILINYMIINII